MYVILGPLEDRKEPKQTGGVLVAFRQFREDLKSVDTKIIDLNIRNYSGSLHALVKITCKLICFVPRSKLVIYNAEYSLLSKLGPLITVVVRLFKKKLVVRLFAGSFDNFFESSTFFEKRRLSFCLRRAALVTAETRSIETYLENMGCKAFWFPNVRRRPSNSNPRKAFHSRFIYLGQISKEKGLLELLEAAKRLPQLSFSVCGPPVGLSVQASKNVQVQAWSLTRQEVLSALNKNDVLVLPSKLQEGYPGVIIEAFSVGLPVVASRIGGIPEIVEDRKSGLLVEPGNVESLVQALGSINQDNYPKMSEEAFEAFENFDSQKHSSRLFAEIERLS